MFLLHLLLGRVVRVSFCELLMFLILLLLQLLPFLVLLRAELFLLLLVLLIQFGVPCIWSGQVFGWRQVVRMDWRGLGSVVVRRSVGVVRGPVRSVVRTSGRVIRASCRVRTSAAAEFSSFRSSSDRRLAVIYRSAQLGVRTGGLDVLNLSGHWPHMLLMRNGLFCGAGTLGDSAVAAVIADMRDVSYVDSGVVDVVDYVDVDVIDRGVVKEMAAVPTPALITVTEVTESVVDPAVPSDLRAPISVIKNETAAAPSPVARSPEVAHFRSHDPCARHPVIIVVAPGPVARNPDISVAGAYRLFVHRYLRRGDGNRDADLRQGCCRHNQKCQPD